MSATRAAMWVHFVHWHVHGTMVILEEGNLPLPRCPWCNLQVSSKALNGRHLETSQCRTGMERKRRRLAEAELEITSVKAFHAYGTKMRTVTEFKYLGRVLTNTDYDWPAVAGNIRKARASWGRLARIMVQEGAELKVTRSFYTAVTQQVLLFGAESWVLTKRMESALDDFQGRVARRLTGRMPRRERDGKWLYLPPGGGSQGGGGREVQEIGPPETEYGRAIHCNTTDSGALRGGVAAAGDTGPIAMVGAIGHRLEASE